MEWGWEEYDPNNPDEMETPVPSETGASENPGNALRATKRRRKE
jgi:hypothetical protein